jgi:hypothetical protein
MTNDQFPMTEGGDAARQAVGAGAGAAWRALAASSAGADFINFAAAKTPVSRAMIAQAT